MIILCTLYNKNRISRLILLFVLFFLTDVRADEYLGPTSIVVGDNPNVLYVLERDACRIEKIDIEAKTKPEFLLLPVTPERMRLTPDQEHLAVVGGGSNGRLFIVDLKTFQITADIPVGHTPSDVAAFEACFYVANRFNGTISVIRQNKIIKHLDAGREPIALTITPDGKTLIVAGHLPEDTPLNFDISSRLRFIDTETGQTKAIRLDIGAMNLRDVLLSPDARYIFVTGSIGHFSHIPNSVTNGWINENTLFVVDIAKRSVVTSYRLDDYGIGSANPWGLSISDDKRFLMIAIAGSSDMMLINLPKLAQMLDSYTGYPQTQPEELAAVLPMQMRIPVGLKGIRYAVMTKNQIFATAYFEDSLAKIVPRFSEPAGFVFGILPHDDMEIPRKFDPGLRRDDSSSRRNNSALNRSNRVEIKVVENTSFQFIPLPSFAIAPGIQFERSFARLGPEPNWTESRYGEMLFHDATLCQEHWQSCATCHPDARSDTLNWDLMNDGLDNPKNTKSLFLSHETPPSMAHGIRDRAETAVRKGFETILMIPATEKESEAVDAYLKSLQPVPSPHLVQGQLSESAKRGRRIFNSDRSGCATCHPEPLFTDMQKHDVGTRSAIDSSLPFDTPTLCEVWRTAPYLHDGRYTTIRQLIVEGKHVNTEGRIDKLTEEEINDLVEYVLSL